MNRLSGLFCIAVALAASPAFAAAPLGYLRGYGPKADPVVQLTWGLLTISITVIVIITGLVVAGTWMRRSHVGDRIENEPVVRGGNGLRWVTIGLGLSSVALVISLVWTMVVLAAVNGPPTKVAFTIEVTGQQWWWKARYLNSDPSQVFITADEIHIPVGWPVRIRLIGADVIHSFWVPALGGKMDAIPGQTNETWIEAREAGRYAGQCSEYCGVQHAHMAFLVVAESPSAFNAWRAAQLLPAATASASVSAGERDFVYHCGACHTVRGTEAGGSVAPELTHLMSRSIIAGGVVPNTIGNLAGWIANPQSIKPGTLMPNLYLSGEEITNITAYLETLQ
jgi:cytochrome c oxidase subunit II